MTILLSLLLSVALASTQASAPTPLSEDDEFLLSFVAGNYVLIGRHPDGGAAYLGGARIRNEDSDLMLERRVGGRVVVAKGRLDAASPGEGKVLRFRWTEGGEKQMTCLVHPDLDNYARITCVWTPVGAKVKEPGVEALFPTAAWPDDAPSKSFEVP